MVRPSKLPLARKLVQRVSLAIQWRIDERVDALARDVDGRLAGLESRVGHLEHVVGTVERRLDDELRFLVDEMQCIAPQVASLEERVEDARVAATRPSDVTSEEAGTGAADEAEHARIRARLSAISLFEERLRRVEVATETRA